MKHTLLLQIIAFVFFYCNATHLDAQSREYETENLIITKISPHVYEHTSFLNTQSFGKVPCNGMIVTDGDEAVVFDTPADNESSVELINFVNNKLNARIKAVIPTHFHADCLAGLKEFHDRNIPSYAYQKTIDYAKEKHTIVPQNKFNKSFKMKVGNKEVYTGFFGEGHTRDNIIGYFPSEKIMFGGCLIKEIGAGKGNLEDANVEAWAATVRRIKKEFPQTEIVIPGHGKSGSTDLLDYTIKLFE